MTPKWLSKNGQVFIPYRRQQTKAGENLRFPVSPWFQIPALTVAQLDGKSIQKTSINIEVNMYT